MSKISEIWMTLLLLHSGLCRLVGILFYYRPRPARGSNFTFILLFCSPKSWVESEIWKLGWAPWAEKFFSVFQDVIITWAENDRDADEFQMIWFQGIALHHHLHALKEREKVSLFEGKETGSTFSLREEEIPPELGILLLSPLVRFAWVPPIHYQQQTSEEKVESESQFRTLRSALL